MCNFFLIATVGPKNWTTASLCNDKKVMFAVKKWMTFNDIQLCVLFAVDVG